MQDNPDSLACGDDDELIDAIQTAADLLRDAIEDEGVTKMRDRIETIIEMLDATAASIPYLG